MRCANSKPVHRLLISIVLFLPLVPMLPPPAETGSEADAARAFTRALIADLEKAKYEPDPAAVSPLIELEAEKLLVHLDANPDDVDAVLALMDLYELSQYFTAVEMPSPSELPDSLGPMGPYIVMRDQLTSAYHRVLDRALLQFPNDPALHAWKGRLHSLYEPLIAGPGIDSLHTQLPQAISELRRAVDLAPEDAAYREWYAILLLIGEAEGEAMDEFARLKGGKHPMYQLLRDWDELPEPDGVTRDRSSERSLAEMSAASGLDFATARFRAYVYPGTAAKLDSLYRQHWPEFRLLADPGEPDESHRSFQQYFRLKKGALRPVAKEGKDIPTDPDEGITMLVFETTGPTRPNVKLPAAVVGASVFCSVLFENHRDLD